MSEAARTSLQASHDMVSFCGESRSPTLPREPLYCPEAPQLIDACTTGDLCSLKRLLGFTKERPDDTPIEEQLPQLKMVEATITHKQSAVLEFLILTYPRWNICSHYWLRTLFAHPHYQTFSVFHACYPCYPGLINEEIDHFNTPLITSCEGGNPLIPDYLIDAGADVNGGRMLGALSFALECGQPLPLVRKLIERGAKVNRMDIDAAIRRQDLSILELILSAGTSHKWQQEINEAKKTGNIEVIRMVKTRASILQRFRTKWLKKGYGKD